MKQFDIHRFGKLARWTLTNDKKYYVRTFLQVLVVMTLFFVIFTMERNGVVRYDGKEYSSDHYTPCFFMSLYVFIITIVIGPSLMFYSMKGKHDQQTLLMLPASNLEKYLMRYSTWILLLPIFLLAFFTADLIQYAVNWLLGHDYTTFVTTHFLYYEHMVSWRAHIFYNLSKDGALIPYFAGLWLHSVYTLGATFFRSHKYTWIFTTIAIIVFAMACGWLFGGESCESSTQSISINTIGYIICAVWAVVNFWLSYRLFCKTQVIGKFVNL